MQKKVVGEYKHTVFRQRDLLHSRHRWRILHVLGEIFVLLIIITVTSAFPVRPWVPEIPEGERWATLSLKPKAKLGYPRGAKVKAIIKQTPLRVNREVMGGTAGCWRLLPFLASLLAGLSRGAWRGRRAAPLLSSSQWLSLLTIRRTGRLISNHGDGVRDERKSERMREWENGTVSHTAGRGWVADEGHRGEGVEDEEGWSEEEELQSMDNKKTCSPGSYFTKYKPSWDRRHTTTHRISRNPALWKTWNLSRSPPPLGGRCVAWSSLAFCSHPPHSLPRSSIHWMHPCPGPIWCAPEK